MKALPHIHEHGVQFYESEQFLCESVCRFLSEGLRRGAGLLIVARAPVRAAIRERLVAAGFDFDAATQAGDVICLDAEDTLNLLRVCGRFDQPHFVVQVGGLIDQLRRGAPKRPVYIYGEMVDVLWRENDALGATHLEDLWNSLHAQCDFKLLCGYAMANFDRSAEGLARVCEAHSHVGPAESYTPQASDDTRAREIVMLQQRVRSLEAELMQRR